MSTLPGDFIKTTEITGPSPCDDCEHRSRCTPVAPDGGSVLACIDFIDYTDTGRVRRSPNRVPTPRGADYLEEREGYRQSHERAHQKRRIGRGA